ncbi:unnamed protein product, partial [Ectocarpus fasciculatus]
MFWSSPARGSASITVNGIWKSVYEDPLVFTIDNNDTSVMVKYHLSVEALGRFDSSFPMPHEAKDSLQVRCIVDGLPYRVSSSQASTFLVEQRVGHTLSNVFVAQMKAGEHSMLLEWRKSGARVQEWTTQLASGGGSGYSSGYSLVASADHDRVWALSDETDEVLTEPGSWKDLGEPLSFNVVRERSTILEYSFGVYPQLAKTVLKDRNLEYVTARIVIDGTPFVEGGSSFGSATWNPSAGVLHNFINVVLAVGNHTVQLQWKRKGSVFKSWSCSPSLLGGFAQSRNLVASHEKFEATLVTQHDRLYLKSDGVWETVAGSEQSITLIKESAILVSYALPVTQYGNPNLDATTWTPLTDLEARVLVDGVAYRYSGSTIAGSSRAIDDAFGNLVLILPAGTHTISLQWKADGAPGKSQWVTLNRISNGFQQGDNLMVIISSENAQPTIYLDSSTLMGAEDTPVEITGVSIGDIDERLGTGMRLKLDLSVAHGVIRYPVLNDLLKTVDYYEEKSSVSITDTLNNLNTILSLLSFFPSADWSGLDYMLVDLSDLGGVGSGGSQTTNASLTFNITAVDDPFQFTFPSSASLKEGDTLVLEGPFEITDIDSASSVFRVQVSSACLSMSLVSLEKGSGIKLPGELSMYSGDCIGDESLDFSGEMDTVNVALSGGIRLHGQSGCNSAVYPVSLLYTVINTNNLGHTLYGRSSVNIVPVNDAPEILLATALPQWSIRGLKTVGSADSNSNEVNFVYIQ